MLDLRSSVVVLVLGAISGAAGAEPAPYSLAWQLRPAVAADVVRADTAAASYRDADGVGFIAASTLSTSFKLTSDVAPVFRIALSRNDPPLGTPSFGISNPLAGVTWAPHVSPPLRVSLFGAITVPVGSGGGDSPNPARAALNRSASMARSAMDGALFSVNDMALIFGSDLALVGKGFTLQVEGTVFQLIQMRGGDAQHDDLKTNFTAGVHAGYFVVRWLSVGGELRYQRWLTRPTFVVADPTGDSRDTMSAAAGVRVHVPMGNQQMLRPGVAYVRGIDKPMATQTYDLVIVDLVFAY